MGSGVDLQGVRPSSFMVMKKTARIYHHLRLPLGDLKLRGSGRDPFNFGNYNFERLLAPKKQLLAARGLLSILSIPAFKSETMISIGSLHQLGEKL